MFICLFWTFFTCYLTECDLVCGWDCRNLCHSSGGLPHSLNKVIDDRDIIDSRSR